jgi:hypothetical protein
MPRNGRRQIPRYRRALSVRTLFQVPYVHLYERALLTDFFEAGFRGLPWRVSADVAAIGDDLAAEIREAFALIIRSRSLLPPVSLPSTISARCSQGPWHAGGAFVRAALT